MKRCGLTGKLLMKPHILSTDFYAKEMRVLQYHNTMEFNEMGRVKPYGTPKEHQRRIK